MRELYALFREVLLELHKKLGHQDEIFAKIGRPVQPTRLLTTLEEVMQHYERLAAGERQPLVGKLAFYVRYGKTHFGARGGGAADDVEVMMAFLQALTGTQRAARPEGVQPPRLWRSHDAD